MLVVLIGYLLFGLSFSVGTTVLDPSIIPKFEHVLFIPPFMPQSTAADTCDYYEIAMRQFKTIMLPPSMNLSTTVWGYGSITDESSFATPAYPLEATVGLCVRVKWINQLVDSKSNFLPHLIPAVDQNLHWANPLGPVDGKPKSVNLSSYDGPVPIVPHLHGAHTTEESDGHPMAWFLPDAQNLGLHAPFGTKYDAYKSRSPFNSSWVKGSAVYEYPNTQAASMLWFHDHALGITRLNVYAGAAGAYILRDPINKTNVSNFVLPTPDIPLVIQDKSFLTTGELYYPLHRADVEGFEWAPGFPEFGEPACGGILNDVKPMIPAEFFADAIVVNGRVWPRLEVAPRRYRFRVLNGCNARFLNLTLQFNSSFQPFYAIGSDGGFLEKPVELTSVLLSPAERLDVIIDFAGYEGQHLVLGSDGPDWVPTDPATTGLILRFDVTLPSPGPDPSTHPRDIVFPPSVAPNLTGLPVRRVAVMPDTLSQSVKISVNDSIASLDCNNNHTRYFGPISGLLGTESANGTFISKQFHDDVTEIVEMGVSEIWEIHNFSPDTHPTHLHQTHFKVLDRLLLKNRSIARPPDPWETGFKDTVISNPGEITRLLVSWEKPGLSLWHCHILEHEDNEMMRPLLVVDRTSTRAPSIPWLIIAASVGGFFLVVLVIVMARAIRSRQKLDPGFTALREPPKGQFGME